MHTYNVLVDHGEGGEFDLHAADIDEACETAKQWVREGGWSTRDGVVSIHLRVQRDPLDLQAQQHDIERVLRSLNPEDGVFASRQQTLLERHRNVRAAIQACRQNAVTCEVVIGTAHAPPPEANRPIG